MKFHNCQLTSVHKGHLVAIILNTHVTKTLLPLLRFVNEYEYALQKILDIHEYIFMKLCCLVTDYICIYKNYFHIFHLKP